MKIHPEMPQNDMSSFGYGPNMYHNIGHVLYETIDLCGVRMLSWFNSSNLPVWCQAPEALQSRFFVEHFAQFNIEGKHPQHLVILSPFEKR
jgi:hypothetical protein